jgi:hypothetical protein
VPSPVIMGRPPNKLGNRRICYCLKCEGTKAPIHRNSVMNHRKAVGYMLPADIANLLEQQGAGGSGEAESEEDDSQLREEETERLVALNQALYQDMCIDDFVHIGRDANNNDRDGDGPTFHGGSDDDEDEDPEWRARQTDEAELLRNTVKKWVSGKLCFLKRTLT